MGDFHGVSEKFSVSMLSDEGHGSERIRCEIGLNGLVISTPDGYRTLRKYPLNHIARWALRGSTLVLYTKTPGDVEELTLTLQGDQRTITSILDTLTCSCMQMVELLQSKESTQDTTEVTNSLTLLLNGENKSKKAQLPLVDEVEFWRDPEKQGWMHSQGEVVKTWRRRWFVLKQGFLFRFSNPDISASTKPRGVVDLSKVTDVSEARDQTNKLNSFKLSTETGYVAYVCDSETELVEWISALEGAVSAIVRKIAGVEHEAAPAPAPKPAVPRDDWSRQLEKVYSSAGSTGGHRSHSSSGGGSRPTNPMVKIVGYDSPAQQSSYSGYKAPENGRYTRQPVRSDYNEYAGSLNQGNISGIAGVARESAPVNPGSTYSDSFTRSEYPAYPVLTPSGSSNPSQNHPSRGQNFGASGYGTGTSGQYPSAAQQYQPAPEQRGYAQQGYDNKAYPAQPPQPPQGSSSWQVHYTDEGRAYYHNAMTGQTQWELPAGGV